MFFQYNFIYYTVVIFIMQYNSSTSQAFLKKNSLCGISHIGSIIITMMQRTRGSDLLADGKLLIQTDEPALEQGRVDCVKIAVLIDVAELFDGSGRVL